MTIPPPPQPLPKILPSFPPHSQTHQPSTLTILPTTHLPTSPFLPHLIQTINLSFHTAHATQPSLGLSNLGDRLTSTSDFLQNFPNPSSFTLIIHPPSSYTVLATASVRPFLGPDSLKKEQEPTIRTTPSPWERNLPIKENCEEWELKLMCTSPSSQGQGFAASMLEIVESEIKNSYKVRVSRGEVEAGRELRIVLCKVQELMGEFYERKGFERDYETRLEEGGKFRIVHMSKSIG